MKVSYFRNITSFNPFADSCYVEEVEVILIGDEEYSIVFIFKLKFLF